MAAALFGQSNNISVVSLNAIIIRYNYTLLIQNYLKPHIYFNTSQEMTNFITWTI